MSKRLCAPKWHVTRHSIVAPTRCRELRAKLCTSAQRARSTHLACYRDTHAVSVQMTAVLTAKLAIETPQHAWTRLRLLSGFPPRRALTKRRSFQTAFHRETRLFDQLFRQELFRCRWPARSARLSLGHFTGTRTLPTRYTTPPGAYASHLSHHGCTAPLLRAY